MVVFPNGKINIGLRILNRRPDGFHNISTCFYPLPFYDALEIIPSEKLKLHVSGSPIKGNINENLCIKAYHLLKADYPNLPFYSIFLHKKIPMGAGLGGGSADAAFMLKALNQKAGLNLSNKQLLPYASQLGSDCSFFIENKPALAKDRGETLQSIEINQIEGYHLLLVCPNINIHTTKAYPLIQPKEEEIPLTELIHKPVNSWKGTVQNDFEKIVFEQHPVLKEIKEALYAKGAVYASLSGSGSTIYGLFSKAISSKDIYFENSIVKNFPLGKG